MKSTIIALMGCVGLQAALLPTAASAATTTQANLSATSAAVKIATAPEQHGVNVSTLAAESGSNDAAIRDFWTPDRVKEALSSAPDVVEGILADKDTTSEVRNFLADVPVKDGQATESGSGVATPEGTSEKPSANGVVDQKSGPQGTISPTVGVHPVSAATDDDGDDLYVNVRKSIGLLLYSNSLGVPFVCTGFSVTPSAVTDSGMVQTAGHCVRDGLGWSSNMLFIPKYGSAFDEGAGQPTGPWGAFPADQMWSGLTQQESGQTGALLPMDRDFAFMTMKRNAQGQRLIDTAGTLGLWGGDGLGDEFTADIFGYDGADANGPGLKECTDLHAFRQMSTSNLYEWFSSWCPVVSGNSGGPIFACEDACGNNFPPIVIGNISKSVDNGPAGGPTFNVAAWSTYQAAGGVVVDPNTPPEHDELIGIPPASEDAPAPASRTAYYTSWSVYANQFYPKDLDTRGIAGKLTTLDYAFENIDPVNLTCMAANKAGSSDDNDTSGNDGAGDAWADYQMGFTSDNSVDGSTDAWDQPLKGNFNQLKQLKAKYPNLKVLVSLGGWTYSKYFSDVAATDAARKKFVSSCIDMYIKGNLPVLDGSPSGGNGVAAGIFDGFDIDWEFPGSANGHPGNHFSADDTANYTLLLQEFRNQLDALGGKHYSLTAAVPSGPSDIDKIQPGSLAGALDMADVMTYDFYGSWQATGPTNFNAQLMDSFDNPDAGAGFDVEDAISEYILRGMPVDKLSVGIPFYARGWTGVSDGGQRGLYQPATGPSPAYSLSQQPGVAFYKELEADGKLNGYWMDYATKSTWVYDGTNWWSVETPQSISYKLQYIHGIGLGGVMMYSLEGDDASSTLLNAAVGA